MVVGQGAGARNPFHLGAIDARRPPQELLEDLFHRRLVVDLFDEEHHPNERVEIVRIIEVVEDDARRGFGIAAPKTDGSARPRLHHHPRDDEAVRRDGRSRSLAGERAEDVQVFFSALPLERRARHDARDQPLIDLVGLARGGEQPERGVVVKVVADRQVLNEIDVVLAKMFRGADAGAHQDRRRREGACGEDDEIGLEDLPRGEPNADHSPVLDHDAVDKRVGAQLEREERARVPVLRAVRPALAVDAGSTRPARVPGDPAVRPAQPERARHARQAGVDAFAPVPPAIADRRVPAAPAAIRARRGSVPRFRDTACRRTPCRSRSGTWQAGTRPTTIPGSPSHRDRRAAGAPPPRRS